MSESEPAAAGVKTRGRKAAPGAKAKAAAGPPPKPPAKTGCRASTADGRREIVAGICRRLAKGERKADILRGPDMPLSCTFDQWMIRYGELHVMYQAALAEGLRVGFRSSMEGARRYCPELARELCRRVVTADRLSDVLGQDGMPCETSFYRWLAEEPTFRDMYREAQEVQAHRRFEMAWAAAEHGRWEGWRGAKLFIDTVRWQLALLAPEVFGGPAAGPKRARPLPVKVNVLRFYDDEP